jgi:hypothetical protein
MSHPFAQSYISLIPFPISHITSRIGHAIHQRHVPSIPCSYCCSNLQQVWLRAVPTDSLVTITDLSRTVQCLLDIWNLAQLQPELFDDAEFCRHHLTQVWPDHVRSHVLKPQETTTTAAVAVQSWLQTTSSQHVLQAACALGRPVTVPLQWTPPGSR